MNNDEKINEIERRLNFWQERLEESKNASNFLNELNDSIKINMNKEDIINFTNIINSLQNALDELKS